MSGTDKPEPVDEKSREGRRQEIRARLSLERRDLSQQNLELAESALLLQFCSYLETHFAQQFTEQRDRKSFVPSADPTTNSSTYNSLNVGGYLATRGEISPASCLSYIRESGGRTFVPVIRDSLLMFAPLDSSTQFRKGRYNINIPVCHDNELLAPEQLDLVLTPLLAFDTSGARLGMGGGYYDRSFAFLHKPLAVEKQARTQLIGVAHDFQRVDDIPVESWDVPLDATVTDKAVYRIQPV